MAGNLQNAKDLAGGIVTESEIQSKVEQYAPAMGAADILTAIKTVDGIGSGLDADLLNGENASYYLPASSYNKYDVLEKLFEVDGAGSGLDADLLDGVQGDSYLRSDINDSVYGLITGTGSSWISQKDDTNVALQESNTEGSGSTYRAFIRSKNATYTYTLGRLSDTYFGFYGYLNTRTANGTDFSCYMDNSGNWTATGNVTAYSDIRVKTNIEVIDNSINKVLQLSGYTFDRTDIETARQTGVIAQEVQKVLPEAVTETDDGKLTVAYGNMVGLLIEAIKELKSEIEELKCK